MNAIAAVNSDWGIGYNGTQPVVIPEDRRRFRMLTSGGIVIVGRKTFENIPGPLPDRKNIVLTRDRSFNSDGVAVAHSVEDVLAEITDADPGKVFVIGGGDLYEQLLPLCAYAYVTKIEILTPSDRYFPDLDSLPDWSLERREPGVWDSESGIGSNIERGSPHCRSSCDGNGSIIRYSFDLYKNNLMSCGLQ